MYDHVNSLKRNRFTAVDREMKGITSHRVIEVRENSLIIGVPAVLAEDGRISIPMSDTSDIKPGTCLDFQFTYTITNGKANSYQAILLGKTPTGFLSKGRATYTAK